MYFSSKHWKLVFKMLIIKISFLVLFNPLFYLHILCSSICIHTDVIFNWWLHRHQIRINGKHTILSLSLSRCAIDRTIEISNSLMDIVFLLLLNYFFSRSFAIRIRTQWQYQHYCAYNLNPPLSTLRAVRSKSEKHVSFGQ